MRLIQLLVSAVTMFSIQSIVADPIGTSMKREHLPIQSSPKPAESVQEMFVRTLQEAEQGDAKAQFFIGASYADGRGVEQNIQLAIQWYEKAAAQGYGSAQVRLGNIYETGPATVQNYSKAVKYYRQAIANGYTAQYLAKMYYDGRGVKQSYTEAFKLYLKSAEAGDINSQYQVGQMYRTGQGAVKDSAKARYWFEKAAQHGQSLARLALMEDI